MVQRRLLNRTLIKKHTFSHLSNFFLLNYTMSTIHELPAEVLVLVFKKLNSKHIQNCANTCVRWRNIVSTTLFQPNLVNFAKHDAKLNEILCQSGWNEDSSDTDLIVFLHEKLKSSERWSKPSKILGPLKIYFPFPNTKELSHSALYENKLYLSFSDGSVQSRSLTDFGILQELHEPNSAVPPSMNSFVPIYVFGNYLIVCFQPESNLVPIYLWNTKSDELLKKVNIQVLDCDKFVKDCCFHVVENAFLIFMTTNSHIIKVRISLTEEDWMEQKMIAQPSLPGMELGSIYLDLNEAFLVVMTGLVTPYNERRQGMYTYYHNDFLIIFTIFFDKTIKYKCYLVQKNRFETRINVAMSFFANGENVLAKCRKD